MTAELEAWNAEHPVGTPVLFWPGSRSGPGHPSVTRSPAWALGMGIPVVAVEGYAGGIALTHVTRRGPWPGHCQSCGAALTPPDARACAACGASDYDEGDSGPVLMPGPAGTHGTLPAGDVRALVGYVEQRDAGRPCAVCGETVCGGGCEADEMWAAADPDPDWPNDYALEEDQ